MRDLLKWMLRIPLTEMKPVEPGEISELDQRIMAAALELFAENGYDGAKTLAIAKKAGTSEKTLFQHFGSKEELFVRTVYPSLLKLFHPFIHSDKDKAFGMEEKPLKDDLQTIAKNRLEFAREHPHVVKFLLQELLIRTSYREAVTDFWMEQISPVMKDYFEARKEAGEIRDLPVPTITRVIVPVFVSYALIRGLMAPGEDWNDDEEIELMLDIIMNGLLPRSSEGKEV